MTAVRLRSRSSQGAVVAATAAVLIAAFLYEHRDEISGLPAAIRALAGAVARFGFINLSDSWQTVAGAAAALLVVTAWCGIGHAVRSAIRRIASSPAATPPGARAAELALTCGLGAGAWSLVWFALGLLQLYRPAVALAAAACGIAFAARAFVKLRRARATRRQTCARPDRLSAAAAAVRLLVAVPVALALVGALAPPTAKDALQYHLALPKTFVSGEGLVPVPGNIASYFALGAEMNGLSAMLVGRVVSARAGEAAFGVAMFAFFPLLLAAVIGWARERGLGREWAWVAGSMVAGVPTIAEVASGGYVDVALALYVALAIRSAGRWWRTLDRASLAESALALGFALSVKLTAAFIASLFALLVLLRASRLGAERAAAGTVRNAAGAVAAVLLVGCPWYVRNWIRTGSPVFPFFASLWPGDAPGWDAARSAMLVGFNALYGADKGPVGYALLPLSVAITGQREVAAAFEGVLGVSFLIGSALIVWALARRVLDPESTIAAGAAAAFFVWWAASAQVLRYLVPALPPLAVASAAAGNALGIRVARRAIAAALVTAIAAGELLMVTWFVSDDPLLAATGAEPRGAYLARRLDYYAYYRAINETLPADATVWLVDVRRDTYHLQRRHVGDYLFEDYTLRQCIERASSGREVQQWAAAAGITHVFIRHDILLDAARSPLVDDQRPASENAARLERLQSFLTDETRILRADRTFALVELPRSSR